MNACIALFFSAVDKTEEDKTSILGINPDQATIYAFFLAAVVAIVASGFAIYKHKKDGVWIKVRLRPALVDHNDVVVKYSIRGRWRRASDDHTSDRGPLAEVALVYIQNVGGTAGTISSPALLRRRWVGLRPHHWFGSQPSTGFWDDFMATPVYEELTLDRNPTEMAASVTIAAHNHVVYAMRFMPFVRDQLNGDPCPSIRLRAAVTVGGQHSTKKSAWRDGWIFKRSTFSTRPWRTVVFTDELLFEALRRSRDRLPLGSDIGLLAELLAASLGNEYKDASRVAESIEDLSAYLQENADVNPDALHARIVSSFHNMETHLKASPNTGASIELRITPRGVAALERARQSLGQ